MEQLTERSGVSLRDRAAGLRPQPASQSSRSSIANAIESFNAYAAWQRSENERRHLDDLLRRAVMLIDSNADRLERRGEDVAHLRAFVREARQ